MSSLAQSADPRRDRRPWLSIRARVIVAFICLTGAALLLAGVSAYALEVNRVSNEIEADLSRAQTSFSRLAGGVDPTTGRRYDSVRELLRVAVTQFDGLPSEGVMGIANGGVVQTANDDVEIRLENDAELVEYATAKMQTDAVEIERVATSTTDWWCLVTPIESGGERGAFVVAFDYRAEVSEISATYSTYAIISLCVLLAVTLAVWFLVGRLLEPIGWVQQTARAISDSDLTTRIPVRGRDDLSRLTVTVNDMLDRLQTTFEEQRQLLDDVAHELRTPITIMRGHLELVDVTDADDVDSTRELALEELDRMKRLVDDLLTLATAHRPDFVKRNTVDVADLTDQVLERASMLGERRWQLDDLAFGTAFLDPQRITQALLQLASNAVKYSPDGSVIAVGSRFVDGGVSMWVRDQGYGIAPEEQERVLTRFGRGSVAQTHGIDGAGLGLAIVSSIVEAHHGRLELVSEPGKGSTFTLVLPGPTTHEGAR